MLHTINTSVVTLWVWGLGALLAIYPATMLVRVSMDFDNEDEADLAMRAYSAFLGVVVAALWPFVLVALLAYRLSREIWRHFFEDEPVDREDARR